MFWLPVDQQSSLYAKKMALRQVSKIRMLNKNETNVIKLLLTLIKNLKLIWNKSNMVEQTGSVDIYSHVKKENYWLKSDRTAVDIFQS